VRHYGFYQKWILTILWPLGTYFALAYEIKAQSDNARLSYFWGTPMSPWFSELGGVNSTDIRRSAALLVTQFQISDRSILLRFKTRWPQKRLGSKI